eukprot:TRINITY_DN25021_c0_g1_i1.p2 TRINITY_DN25021_c0_g1~~TRINITY_DN25021_c0_g1_i1.p2  ORF type:complete len:166 (+),score=35.34 TRINITY_DN25021_c0_g1_i1:70-567(+)
MAMPQPPPSHPSSRTGNVPAGSIGPLPPHMADLGSPERMRIGSPAECLANSPSRLRGGSASPGVAMPSQALPSYRTLSASPSYGASPPSMSKTMTTGSIPQFPQQVSKVSAPYGQAPQYSRPPPSGPPPQMLSRASTSPPPMQSQMPLHIEPTYSNLSRGSSMQG